LGQVLDNFGDTTDTGWFDIDVGGMFSRGVDTILGVGSNNDSFAFLTGADTDGLILKMRFRM
jgi:hypothetical protein